jgi:hypothetical protein
LLCQLLALKCASPPSLFFQGPKAQQQPKLRAGALGPQGPSVAQQRYARNTAGEQQGRQQAAAANKSQRTIPTYTRRGAKKELGEGAVGGRAPGCQAVWLCMLVR